MTFILASGSASRKAILAAAGVPFCAIPADIDESRLKDRLLADGMAPAQIAAALADAKAQQVSGEQPDALVLGADQALLFEGELISKCADLPAARALLSRLRAKSHRLVSALSLARNSAVIWRFVAESTLRMRDFSDAFLDNYLDADGAGILGCVGCYKLEGPGSQLFDSVEGDYFSILGLPLQPLLAELRRQGAIAS